MCQVTTLATDDPAATATHRPAPGLVDEAPIAVVRRAASRRRTRETSTFRTNQPEIAVDGG